MRILLIVCFLFAGTPVAQACGNPLLWAMLFAKVPDAKIVYEAELAARSDGVLKARVFDGKPGQPYHVWSKKWVMTLATEMQPLMNAALENGDTFTILLADEVAALRFVKNADPVFVPAASLRGTDSYDAITTINALNSAWRYGLSYQQLLRLNLVLSDGQRSDERLTMLF